MATYSFELPEPTGTSYPGDTMFGTEVLLDSMSGSDVLLGEDAPYRYLDPDAAIDLSQRLIAAGLKTKEDKG